MNYNQKYVAFLEIRSKILQSDGQKFEDLFVSIMECYDKGFKPVKPQGRIGDKKNDGFISNNNEYFQVYGPEDIGNSIDYAIAKIKEDSEGLVNNWPKVEIVNYVVNDKYKGVYPTVFEKINKLKEAVNEISNDLKIEVNLWTAKNVEDKFLELSSEDMSKIITIAFMNYNNVEIDYNILTEVIEHISKIPSLKTGEKVRAPNFIEKIEFNNLSKELSNRMNGYHLESSELDIYFDNVGNFMANTLREKFNNLYLEAKEEYKTQLFDEKINKNNDFMYFYILEKIRPEKATVPYIACIESLMAYYFESCDIYEEPTKVRSL